MGQIVSMKSARDFQSAFQVEPEIGAEANLPQSVGIYRWSTPAIEGFTLPGCEDLVIAMHLGGSRRVRSITEHGPSPSRSSPGLLTILPAGQPAAFRTEGSVRLLSLHVSRDAFAVERLRVPRFAFQDPFAGAAMEALLQAACDGHKPKAEYIARISEALLYHLAHGGAAQSLPSPSSAAGNEPRDRDLFSRLQSYIDAHLGDRLDIDELAARAGLSRATLARRFRQATGLSPHQFVVARRIEAAKVLLRDSGLDLCFIAQEVGFASQSHLTSMFRQATGFTPNRFRRHH